MARGAPEVKIIRVAPSNSTSAYSTGHQFGTLMTLSQAAPDATYGTILHSIAVLDKDKKDSSFDIVIFDASQTIASSDRTTFDITDANLFSGTSGKILGVAQVSTYVDFNQNSVGIATGLNIVCAPAANVDLYAIAIIRTANTYTTNPACQFVFGFIQDRRD